MNRQSPKRQSADNDAAKLPFGARLKGSAQKIGWAGLSAIFKAQESSQVTYSFLLEEGESLQQRAVDLSTESLAQASGMLQQLEELAQAQVAGAMKSLGLTTRKDIQALSKRVEQLTAQVKAINDNLNADKAALHAASEKERPE